MPAILRTGSYRFFFYSNENGKPAHIHVQRENMLAKFWLKPVSLASAVGFSSPELAKLKGLVKQHRTLLLESYDEYFSS